MNYLPVPFKFESGASHVSGLAKFSPAGIIIEYESKFLGYFGGSIKEIRINKDEIVDIRLKRGLLKFGASIAITLSNFKKVAKFPNKDGKIVIRLKRENFELAERALINFHSEIEPVTDEPRRVSVGELFEDNQQSSERSRFNTNSLNKK